MEPTIKATVTDNEGNQTDEVIFERRDKEFPEHWTRALAFTKKASNELRINGSADPGAAIKLLIHLLSRP